MIASAKGVNLALITVASGTSRSLISFRLFRDFANSRNVSTDASLSPNPLICSRIPPMVLKKVVKRSEIVGRFAVAPRRNPSSIEPKASPIFRRIPIIRSRSDSAVSHLEDTHTNADIRAATSATKVRRANIPVVAAGANVPTAVTIAKAPARLISIRDKDAAVSILGAQSNRVSAPMMTARAITTAVIAATPPKACLDNGVVNPIIAIDTANAIMTKLKDSAAARADSVERVPSA